MRMYSIELPLPVSVNASHAIGRGRKGQHIIRSVDYKNWLAFANQAWREQYRGGVREQFQGRISLHCIFLWRDGARGTATADLDNRLKSLQDFLQGKFYENDNQIDEIHAYRRLTTHGENRVMARVIEIQETRHRDVAEIFR